MSEYIDRKKLLEELNQAPAYFDNGDIRYGIDIAFSEVLKQPIADVQEVKHGYWEDKFNRNRMATQTFCSVCGKHSGIGGIDSNRHKPYCPNCGAKMDKEVE